MKRVFFISFLFVILQSVNAFCSLSVEDFKQMEIEGKEPTWNEITQDQTSYENWLDYLTEKTNAHYTMPSFGQVADLTANLLAYSVGNYADVASGVFDNLADTFSLGSDIWDFMTFNVQQMAFDYAPDFVNLMRSGVDEEIYSEPTGLSNFYPSLSTDPGSEQILNNFMFLSDNSYAVATFGNPSVFMTMVKSGSSYVPLLCVVSDSPVTISTRARRLIGRQDYVGSLTLSNHYVGSISEGYYLLWDGRIYEGNAKYDWLEAKFNTLGAALSRFFGEGVIVDDRPLLHDAIIVNESPVINPVTLTSALGYPYKETIINNYNNNTPIPWRPNNYNYVDYNYNYEVPFWEGQELETIAYPEEIEFPSVEFETVAVDTNIDTAIEGLSGWIIEFLLIAILLLVLGLII